MATSSKREIEAAIISALNEDPRALEGLLDIPDRIAEDLRRNTPVLTGGTERSIEVAVRKTQLKKLGKRKAKLGTVFFEDEDPAKIAALEYGRGADDKHGATPEFGMIRRTIAEWMDKEL